MADWSELRHAYGPADDIPALLQRLDPNPGAEVWGELWSRLCHQGTVYSASYAALPALTATLAEWQPADRLMGLDLAAAIVASADAYPGIGDVRQRYQSEIATVARLTEECRQASASIEPWSYIYVLQAGLAFEGVPIWNKHLDRLVDGEYEAPCPSCRTENCFAVNDYLTNQGATFIPLRPASPDSLEGLAARLHKMAHDAGQDAVADQLTYLFGRGTCPKCLTTYVVADAFTATYVD